MLMDILNAREERWNSKLKLIEQYHLPVISFMLNIPGSEKTKPLYLKAHHSLLEEFQHTLTQEIVAKKLLQGADGPCMLFVVKADARELKKAAMLFESTDCGRVCDIDVLTQEGVLLSRSEEGLPLRRCYLCGRPAKECISGKRHPLDEVIKAFELRLEKKFI